MSDLLSVDDSITTTSDAPVEEENLLASNPAEAPDNNLVGDAPVGEDEVAEAAPETPIEAEEGESQEPDPEEIEQAVAAKTGTEAPETRAQKRIRESVARAKAAEEKLASMQASYNQQYQQMYQQMQQQMQQQNQALQEQLNLQRYQLEQQEYKKQQELEANLSPGEKLEREWLRRAKQETSTEIQQLRQEIQAEREQRNRLFQQARAQRELQTYKTRADEAAKKVVLAGIPTEAHGGMSEKLQELILTWGAAAGQEPEQAVQGLQKFLDDYHKARLKSTSLNGGAKIKASQTQVPKPVSTSKVAAKGDVRPPMAKLKARGYDNYIQWRAAGAPAL